MDINIFEFLNDSKHFIVIELDHELNILNSNKAFNSNLNFNPEVKSIYRYLSTDDKNEINLSKKEINLNSVKNENVYFKCKLFNENTIKIIGEIHYKKEYGVIEQMSRINNKLASTTRELHKKNSLLKQANEELIEKEKIILSQSRSTAMNELLVMLAHQWRQPLNSISLNNTIIQNLIINSDCQIDDAKEYIEKIETAVKALSNKINIFSSKLGQEQTEHINVESIIDDVYHIILHTFKNQNIQIVKKYEDTPSLNIVPSVLQQVLLIVVQNSLDAFERSKTTDKKLEISTNEDEEYIYIKLVDNATGIEDKETLLKLFDPYYSTKYEQNDVGLGLYIAKTLCSKVLSGSIDITSQNNTVTNTIKISKNFNQKEIE